MAERSVRRVHPLGVLGCALTVLAVLLAAIPASAHFLTSQRLEYAEPAGASACGKSGIRPDWPATPEDKTNVVAFGWGTGGPNCEATPKLNAYQSVAVALYEETPEGSGVWAECTSAGFPYQTTTQVTKEFWNEFNDCGTRDLPAIGAGWFRIWFFGAEYSTYGGWGWPTPVHFF